MSKKIEDLLNYEGIKEGDMPQIPLYMDQLLGFFEEYFEVLKIHEDDKLLTKTMVNNYVKAGVMNPPIKKKYTKDQLMLLTLIVQMKNILSISDLKVFLDHFKGDEESDNRIAEVYDKFKAIEEKQFHALKEQTEAMELDLSNSEESWDFALDLIIEANVKKRLAEMLLAGLPPKDVKEKKKKA